MTPRGDDMAAADPVEASEPLPCLPGWVKLKLGNFDVNDAPVGKMLLLDVPWCY